MRSFAALVGWGAGDVALARLSWPWDGVCLVGWAIVGMALLVFGAAHALSGAVSHQRHRWANHAQLVAGWLEMGRIDEASRIMARARASSGWLVSLPDWAKLVVWWLDARADAVGVSVAWPGQASAGHGLGRALYGAAAALNGLERARRTGTVAVEAAANIYVVRVVADGPPPRATWYFWGVRFHVERDAQRWQWLERPHVRRIGRGG